MDITSSSLADNKILSKCNIDTSIFYKATLKQYCEKRYTNKLVYPRGSKQIEQKYEAETNIKARGCINESL